MIKKIMKRGASSIEIFLIMVMVLCSFYFIGSANAYYGSSQWSSFGSYFNNLYSYNPNNVGFANSYSEPYNYAWSYNYNIPSIYNWSYNVPSTYTTYSLSYSPNSYSNWSNITWYGNTLISPSLYADVIPPPQNVDSVNGNNPAPAPGLYTQGSLGNVSTCESLHAGPVPDHNGDGNFVNWDNPAPVSGLYTVGDLGMVSTGSLGNVSTEIMGTFGYGMDSENSIKIIQDDNGKIFSPHVGDVIEITLPSTYSNSVSFGPDGIPVIEVTGTQWIEKKDENGDIPSFHSSVIKSTIMRMPISGDNNQLLTYGVIGKGDIGLSFECYDNDNSKAIVDTFSVSIKVE